MESTLGFFIPGHLYEFLYRGSSFIGYFKTLEDRDTKACFYCFNIDLQGGFLYFPVDELSAYELPS